MLISSESDFGKRVLDRLSRERIIWLTTADRQGRPQPRPVWFLWENESITVYSRPDTAKIRHINHNPKVSLNFDGDGLGGDIIVFTAEAKIMKAYLSAGEHEAYCEKYSDGIKRLGMTPDKFSDVYSAVIKITPGSLRGH